MDKYVNATEIIKLSQEAYEETKGNGDELTKALGEAKHKWLTRALEAAPAVDVIPVDFIEEWFRKHYRAESRLVADWRERE